ncbi:MAG: hypothetical protein K1X28_07250 [Parachlamydiales bacterium]|nr:hypothetical protein [Parachlamydiales bacterium]
MNQLESQIGRNICVLANACKLYRYCPDCALRFLRMSMQEGAVSFSQFEKALLKAQRTYSESLGYIRTFSESVRRKMYDILTDRTEYFRFKTVIPLFDRDIENLEKEMDERGEQAKRLQQRIQNGIGDKVEQKAARDRLLLDNSYAGAKLQKIRESRELYAVRIQTVLNRGNLRRAELFKSCADLSVEAFKQFEELIQEREKIRADFFYANNWTRLLFDCKVQDAFDGVLRTIVSPPKGLCKSVCDVVRSFCRRSRVHSCI